MLSPGQARKVQCVLWEADLALGQREYRVASQKVWDATALAIKFVAEERGWPHATFEEVYAAGRKIAHEQADEFSAESELNYAESHRANAQWKVFEDYEVIEDWDLAPSFIERILGRPARQIE